MREESQFACLSIAVSLTQVARLILLLFFFFFFLVTFSLAAISLLRSAVSRFAGSGRLALSSQPISRHPFFRFFVRLILAGENRVTSVGHIIMKTRPAHPAAVRNFTLPPGLPLLPARRAGLQSRLPGTCLRACVLILIGAGHIVRKLQFHLGEAVMRFLLLASSFVVCAEIASRRRFHGNRISQPVAALEFEKSCGSWFLISAVRNKPTNSVLLFAPRHEKDEIVKDGPCFCILYNTRWNS